jgi:adenylate kinase family enzyme
MERVAVFGNVGGGKSTLSRRLSELTGLPLYVLDIVRYRDGRYRAGEKDGGRIDPEHFANLHSEILRTDRWIIDGYGNAETVWKRFSAADTLIYIDLPVAAHVWGVTTRLAAGLFDSPKGWPENSPVWESTLDSYRSIWPCHRRVTPRYREYVARASAIKRVHHLRSRADMAAFLDGLGHDRT